MIKCPYCGAENRDDAAACYFCGNNLRAWSPSSPRPDPTQPVNTGNLHSTQPFPPATPYPGYPQAVNLPDGSAPRQGYQPPQAQQPGYGQNSGYPPNQTYPAQPTYQPQPVYYPPPPPPPAKPKSNGPSRIWPVLLIGLVLVFLCVASLAFATIASATGSGAGRLGSQFSTQIAQVFNGGNPAPLPLPTEPASVADTPSPWPTFTPAPSETPQPVPPDELPAESATPDATQANYIKKLLSKECSSALEHLQSMSNQLSSNPAAPLDESWRQEFNQAVDDMKSHCGSLDSASPVPGLISDAHENLTLANQEFDQAGKLFDDGVKELNPSKLLEAGGHIQQAAKYLDKAIAAIRKIGQ